MSSSDPVTTMLGAAASGQDFPASVPDTAQNRAMFAEMRREIAAAPPGTVVQIPAEYAE